MQDAEHEIEPIEKCHSFFSNMKTDVCYCKLINNTDKINPTLKSPEDFLNWKFNLIKNYLEQYKPDIYNEYKQVFECDNQNQQNIYKELINQFQIGSGDNMILVMCFQLACTVVINFPAENKINLDIDFINKLNNIGTDKVVISPDHALIKIFKGIYRWCENKTPSVTKICINKFLGNSIFVEKLFDCFSNVKAANSVFKNIQKLECQDQEFAKFKEQLKGYVFEENRFVNKQEYQNSIYTERTNMQYPPLYDNDVQTTISRMKLFLLIASVLFFVATIFFAINLVCAFLAITQTLAIILVLIITIAFVIFLAMSIKKNVINPPCFSDEKSFIDLYQNEGKENEVPEQSQDMDIKNQDDEKNNETN